MLKLAILKVFQIIADIASSRITFSLNTSLDCKGKDAGPDGLPHVASDQPKKVHTFWATTKIKGEPPRKKKCKVRPLGELLTQRHLPQATGRAKNFGACKQVVRARARLLQACVGEIVSARVLVCVCVCVSVCL